MYQSTDVFATHHLLQVAYGIHIEHDDRELVFLAENADGLKDIADAQDAIASKGGKKPRFVFMEKKKFQQLCNQASVARRLYPLAKENTVTSDMITLAAINRYMTDESRGWPQIVILDTYATIQYKDGSEETIKPWNVNVVTLAPVAQLGWTYYKPVPNVPNTEALQEQGSYYKMTRYSDINPMLEVTMAEAYVQPGLINRASLVFINTAATTWNNGDAK